MPNRLANEEILWLSYEIRKIAKECPVKLFVAMARGGPSKFFWPYKLFTPKCASVKPKLCDYWILDSDIFDAEIDNETIMESERKYKPDFVVPKDYLGDSEKSCQSALNFLDVYEGDAEIIAPLQPPHVESYDILKDHFSYFAIASVRTKKLHVDWIQTRKAIQDILRETDARKLHLFGVSFPSKLIDFVLDERIVSCDSRAWHAASVYGEYACYDGTRIKIPTPKGKYAATANDTRTVSALLDQAISLINHRENISKQAWWMLESD
jgi:hypothetical protein